jgi:hypothetical protein
MNRILEAAKQTEARLIEILLLYLSESNPAGSLVKVEAKFEVKNNMPTDEASMFRF